MYLQRTCNTVIIALTQLINLAQNIFIKKRKLKKSTVKKYLFNDKISIYITMWMFFLNNNIQRTTPSCWQRAEIALSLSFFVDFNIFEAI